MSIQAVLVETRNLPNLREIIHRHIWALDNWELIIFGSDENKWLEQDYPCVHHTVSIPSPRSYNQLLTSQEFWQKLSGKVLLFQHDSSVLRKGIEEFLDWDYVGSPWACNAPWAHPECKGGNGGFSLRDANKHLELVRHYRYHPRMGNEDVYFTRNLHKVNGQVAPLEICQKWGMETQLALGTVGVHGIENYFDEATINRILTQYDEVDRK